MVLLAPPPPPPLLLLLVSPAYASKTKSAVCCVGDLTPRRASLCAPARWLLITLLTAALPQVLVGPSPAPPPPLLLLCAAALTLLPVFLKCSWFVFVLSDAVRIFLQKSHVFTIAVFYIDTVYLFLWLA